MFDDKELKTITGKLDLMYAALLSTQELYLNAQSNNQVNRLRIDLKEKAIERKKILVLSNSNSVSLKKLYFQFPPLSSFCFVASNFSPSVMYLLARAVI